MSLPVAYIARMFISSPCASSSEAPLAHRVYSLMELLLLYPTLLTAALLLSALTIALDHCILHA